ncbi:sugar phosphate isomerase/epimerase family protein [Cryptosporangium sp. NPDC048952]|uniref:sugar phosphate isomerase/epimerase family protein n=1 Tax=Cryptosporangium sp. NPDC048952 TaxID=3363961 RepID=UPI00371F3809
MATHPGVTLALTPNSRWALPFAEVVEATGAAGFSALGVPRAQADRAMADAFARSGLECHEIVALVMTADSEATVAFAERLATAAETMGARWVNTVFPPGPAVDIGTLRRCAAIFAEVGAGMAVEFSPLGTVTSIAMARELVATIGHDRAAVQIDNWHFSFGDSTWADLADLPLDQIAYVQFTDAAAPRSDDLMTETLTRRLLPGDGSLELERFATTLLDRGWQGFVSVEVLNDELAAPSVPAFVDRAYASSARYWR